MVTVWNSNHEIIPNIDWEFRSRNGGLNCFRIYTHYIKCRKKNCTFFLKFNYIHTVHHLMEGVEFFLSNFLYYNTWKQLEFAGIAFNYVILCFTIPTFYFLNFLCVRFKVRIFLLQSNDVFFYISWFRSTTWNRPIFSATSTPLST
jgi:hypothetical protein